ncbi:sphingosine kinase 1 isoform 4-T4 [Glossophaga mutica]
MVSSGGKGPTFEVLEKGSSPGPQPPAGLRLSPGGSSRLLRAGWLLQRQEATNNRVRENGGDSAAGGNDAGAPRAQVPGGEGEPHSPYRDARLGSTDKELKAGATDEGSAPGALGSPRQRTPRVKVMDPARAPQNQLPRPCLVLVLLNPRGGKGKALQLFRSHVQPLLAQADVSFRLLLTERRNHARELVRTEELGRWDALVVMSGDGVMHEVVNGLMERPDWETAIRKPLCSLPAGSGNALAASLNHYAGDPVWLAGPRSLGGGRGGRMRTFSLQLRAGDERRPPEQLHAAALPQAAGPHEPAVPAHALGAARLLRAQPGLGLHRRRGHREREVPAPRGEALHGGHPPAPGGPARLPGQTGLPPCRAGGLRGARPPSSGPAGPAGPRGRPPRAPGGAGARSLDGGAGAGLRAGSGAAALTPGQ